MDRQVHIQIDRLIYSHIDSCIEKMTGRWIATQIDGQIYRQIAICTDRYTGSQSDRQMKYSQINRQMEHPTDRKTDRWTDTQIDSKIYRLIDIQVCSDKYMGSKIYRWIYR